MRRRLPSTLDVAAVAGSAMVPPPDGCPSAGQVQPSGIVAGVWRFNNSRKVFEAGFFNTPGAPTDFSTTGPKQSLFICVTASGTFPTGVV